MVLGVRMWQFVRRGVLVGALVVAGLAVGIRPAQAGEVAGMSFVHCTDFANSTTTYYLLVGGSPIKTNVADFGYTTANVAQDATVTSRTCASLPDHPASGTMTVPYSKGAAETTHYEIVGGAPIKTTRASSVKIGASSLAASALLAPSTAAHPCGTALAGCLTSAPVPGTTFKGTGGSQYYSVDSAEHINPLAAAAPSKAVIVDQAQINACTRMNCNVFGQVQSVDSPGYGLLHLSGYALDSVTPVSLNVHVTLGTLVYDFPANQTQEGTLFGRVGSNSYDRTLAVPAGQYAMCISYTGGAAPGTTADMGCSNVSVPGAKPGKVHRPKVKVKGHGKVRVKWKTPAQNGSPVNLYVVKVSVGSKHKKKQVAGAKHKVVLKHLPRGQQVQVKVKANNLYGFGPASKKSKPVRVR
jgi:hypothetical protein